MRRVRKFEKLFARMRRHWLNIDTLLARLVEKRKRGKKNRAYDGSHARSKIKIYGKNIKGDTGGHLELTPKLVNGWQPAQST